MIEVVDKSCTTYNIKDGTKFLCGWAFFGCDSLSSITIPNSVTSIGRNAFNYCKSLTSVTIPSSVTYIAHATFNGCTSLTEIICEAETPPSTDDESFLYYDPSIATLYVPAGSKKLYESDEEWKKFGKILEIDKTKAISVSPSSLVIDAGKSRTISYTLTPSDATTTVTWTSDNESIATVSASGEVKGIKPGKTYIRAITANGLSSSCEVTVILDPTAITLSESSLSMDVGTSKTLTYTLAPLDATTNVIWISDDESIATVSKSGVVQGVKAGTTIINAKTENGLTAKCKVTVVVPIIDPVAITVSSSSLTIDVGKSKTLGYQLFPIDATTTVTWTSDDERVATVSSTGVVTGISAGTTYINVMTANGKIDYCKVRVEEDPSVGVNSLTVGTDARNSTTRIYNISGKRLGSPQKGINIINGKKIVVK